MAVPIYNDGNIPFGSYKVTIGATQFVAEEIDFDDNVHVIDRLNEVGQPNAQVIIPQKVSGRMVLQVPSNLTPIPNVCDIANFPYRGVTKNFIFSKISQPWRQLDYLKLHVEFVEKLN